MQDLSLVALRHKGFPFVFIAPIEACKTATTLYSPTPSIFKHGSVFNQRFIFWQHFHMFQQTRPSVAMLSVKLFTTHANIHPDSRQVIYCLSSLNHPSHLHQSLPTFSLRSLPSRAALKTTFLNSRPVAAILKSFKFDSLTSSRPQNPSLRSKLC